MRKAVQLIAAALCCAASAAHAQILLPVETTATEDVRLVGVVAERGDDAISVRGWVRRESSAFGLVRAHLHLSSLDAEGRVLAFTEARWSGGLPTGVRHRHAARFDVRLPNAATARRIRVSVEADHGEGR